MQLVRLKGQEERCRAPGCGNSMCKSPEARKKKAHGTGCSLAWLTSMREEWAKNKEARLSFSGTIKEGGLKFGNYLDISNYYLIG